MIDAAGVTKTFWPGRGLFDIFKRIIPVKALSGVDLTVDSGEVFALLGPNGAGKTTLIKVLCSLIYPDSGNVSIAGFDIRQQAKLAKRQIGIIVGEERSFYWRLTCRQNLMFFATLYNIPRKEARRKTGEVASLLNLEDLDRRYQECSTGIKQRLAIARCLLSDANVILMDEPTRSLDPLAAADLRRLMKDKLSRELNKTILFTSHHTHEAEEIADRIAIIDHGKIKIIGTLSELKRQAGKLDAGLEDIYRWAVSS